VKQGDLLFGVRAKKWKDHRRARRAGVRAAIVAKKCGNAHGAKGRREVETRRRDRRKETVESVRKD
jgi:hypothetical protein